MLFGISFSTCNRVGKQTAWILIRLRRCAGCVQAGLDPCWSQMHYVGFVMTRLNFYNVFSENEEHIMMITVYPYCLLKL
jgi:hypothetical protein